MKYLIDVNVPDSVSIFKGKQFTFVKNLDPTWSDREIWHFALQNGFVIVTKDSDFFYWAMATEQAPKIVHLKIGNMRLQAFSDWINKNWNAIETLLEKNVLITAYQNHLDVIEKA